MHISIVAGTPASLPSTETTPGISKTTQGMIKVSIQVPILSMAYVVDRRQYEPLRPNFRVSYLLNLFEMIDS